jgi:predicted amidohydrolase
MITDMSETHLRVALAQYLSGREPAIIVEEAKIAQMRGRASETVVGIAVANYPAPRCDGHSFATDPSGAVIVMADTSPGLSISAFDLRLIRKARIKDRFRWQV